MLVTQGQVVENGTVRKVDLNHPGEFNFYLNNIIESIGHGVIVIDLEGKITLFNRAASRVTGLDSKSVIGKKWDMALLGKCIRSFPMNPESLPAVEQQVDIETEIRQKGNKISYLCMSVSPLIDPENKKIGAVLTLQDITRMKKLEEQAKRTNRLAAMGEMAVKIAHEIRNPLGSIELFTTALRQDLKESPELTSLAEYISSGVKSINTIISNLLLFIKPHQKPDLKIIDPHDNLKDALFFSHHLMNSLDGITINTRFCEDRLMLKGDPELLKQMSLNLILNAVQAMPDGGTLTISTRKIRCRRQWFVEVIFADTGTGISQEDRKKIFDPFFTTKPNGTGLGLAIVHNITNTHGGTVDITCPEEIGTRCVITLPLWIDKSNTYEEVGD